jgi:hypothetical protein
MRTVNRAPSRETAALCASVALLLGGCASIVDIDHYGFDEDPCGPRPSSCVGGREVAFVVRRSELPRLDEMGRRDGFDLDGTGDAVCGHRDLTAPDGRDGIDNQMTEILELYEQLAMVSLPTASARSVLAAEDLQLIILSHVDDLRNDDCVSVARRPGTLPAGTTLEELDQDGDGLLDPDLTFDVGGARGYDDTACIRDGLVEARFLPIYDTLPGTEIEGIVERGRLRMNLATEQPYSALLGGSVRLADLDSLPVAVTEFLRPRADLEPSSRSARDCSAISFGIYLDLAPCTLGERSR